MLLGKTIKYFLQNGYELNKDSFMEFVLFMEKCKGYEEDAKRFIFLTTETENLDFSYDLIRPIFLRHLAQKTGNEVLQLFEQIRKNMKLNKTAKGLNQQQRHDALMKKKREFYDGLLQDLLDQRAFSLAQVVYSEKMREKFEVTVDD